MYMSLEACCCSSNLRFSLYCLLYSAFFCFLTASMLISAILVTRCACATLDSFSFFVHCVTSRTRYGVCAVSKVIRNNRAVRPIHVNPSFCRYMLIYFRQKVTFLWWAHFLTKLDIPEHMSLATVHYNNRTRNVRIT
jgi:hypothetical protein